MHDANILGSQKYNLVNELTNPRLESALRAVLYSPNEKNRDGFLRELLSSHVIIYSNQIHAQNDPSLLTCLSDDEGFSYYRKDTIIPVVQLKDSHGNLILPAYTSSIHIQNCELSKDFYGITLLCISVFEMALAAQTSKITLNPETAMHIEIDRVLIAQIIECLQDAQILDGEGFHLSSVT